VASGCLQLPSVACLSLIALGRSARRSPRDRLAARRVATGRHGSDELNLGGECVRVKSDAVNRCTRQSCHGVFTVSVVVTRNRRNFE